MEAGVAVVDATIEIRSPCDPAAATRQVCDLLKAYKLTSTIGDKYASGWTSGEFAKHGIRYQYSDKSCSDTYLAVLPAFNAGKIRLLDNRRLATQFSNLTRRTTAMGRDVVDHPVAGMDDLAAATALALSSAAKGSGVVIGKSGAIIITNGPRTIPGSDTLTAGAQRARDRMIASGGG